MPILGITDLDISESSSFTSFSEEPIEPRSPVTEERSKAWDAKYPDLAERQRQKVEKFGEEAVREQEEKNAMRMLEAMKAEDERCEREER